MLGGFAVGEERPTIPLEDQSRSKCIFANRLFAASTEFLLSDGHSVAFLHHYSVPFVHTFRKRFLVFAFWEMSISVC